MLFFVRENGEKKSERQYYRSLWRRYFGDTLFSGSRRPPTVPTPLSSMPGGAKHFSFTLNNYASLLDPSLWPHCEYCVYQEEIGEAGTPHLQGYVVFTKKRTLATVKKLDGLERAHFETCRGTPQDNYRYCTKPDGRLGGPYVWPDGASLPSGQGARKDLGEIAKRIKDGASLKRIAEDHPSDFIRYHKGFQALQTYTAPRRRHDQKTICFVFFGSGGAGKTTFARRLAHFLASEDGASGDVFSLAPVKGSGQYWDGYNQHDVVLIDEFKGNRMQPTEFNQLIDAGEHCVPVHGGQVQFNSKYVLITTNVHPTQWWPAIQFQHSLRRRIILFPVFHRLDYVRPAHLPPRIFDRRMGVFRHDN